MQLISLLNDGKIHSSSEIAARLGISRSGVSRKLKSLIKFGLSISSVRGRGYRLENRVELLCADAILDALTRSAQSLVSQTEIFEEIDSTNLYLMRKAGMQAPSGYVCLAEYQHAGRGRHGRRWIAPYASNICLSLLWRFTTGSRSLTGLSLAIGVAVARALQEIGVSGIGLKWPNDVMWQGRKLAGILIDTGGQTSGACHAVIGVGLNVAMPLEYETGIDQAWVDLRKILGPDVKRNRCAGVLLKQLLAALCEFQTAGLAAFRHEWKKFDVLAGALVSLQLPHETLVGTVQGIDDDGSLRLLSNGLIRSYPCGEVSVRQLRDHRTRDCVREELY